MPIEPIFDWYDCIEICCHCKKSSECMQLSTLKKQISLKLLICILQELIISFESVSVELRTVFSFNLNQKRQKHLNKHY